MALSRAGRWSPHCHHRHLDSARSGSSTRRQCVGPSIAAACCWRAKRDNRHWCHCWQLYALLPRRMFPCDFRFTRVVNVDLFKPQSHSTWSAPCSLHPDRNHRRRPLPSSSPMSALNYHRHARPMSVHDDGDADRDCHAAQQAKTDRRLSWLLASTRTTLTMLTIGRIGRNNPKKSASNENGQFTLIDPNSVTLDSGACLIIWIIWSDIYRTSVMIIVITTFLCFVLWSTLYLEKIKFLTTSHSQVFEHHFPWSLACQLPPQ